MVRSTRRGVGADCAESSPITWKTRERSVRTAKDRVNLAGVQHHPLLPRTALSRSRRRGPQLPFRYLQGTDQRDYRRRRSNKLSIFRPVRVKTTDGVSFETAAPRNNPGTSESQGAKQRGASGRKTEECGRSLLKGGYRRTLVLNCRSKGT